jgi:hypothetical protein
LLSSQPPDLRKYFLIFPKSFPIKLPSPLKSPPPAVRGEGRLRVSHPIGKDKGMTLFVLPVTILEVVWVAEKVYRLSRKSIRELVEAILNVPELKCPLKHVFRKALITYET